MTQETATTREGLLHEIIERELVMFLATPNEGGVAQCQMHPDAFRTMRRMTHCIHDDATLVSYLHDLRLAAETGRNFMIEKYARMDDRLPPLSSSHMGVRVTLWPSSLTSRLVSSPSSSLSRLSST